MMRDHQEETNQPPKRGVSPRGRTNISLRSYVHSHPQPSRLDALDGDGAYAAEKGHRNPAKKDRNP